MVRRMEHPDSFWFGSASGEPWVAVWSGTKLDWRSSDLAQAVANLPILVARRKGVKSPARRGEEIFAARKVYFRRLPRNERIFLPLRFRVRTRQNESPPNKYEYRFAEYDW